MQHYGICCAGKSLRKDQSMSGTDIMTHSKLILHPDPSRTILRPFDPVAPDLFCSQGSSSCATHRRSHSRIG